jgi:sugar phosphate isomerase/epimerase
VLKAAAAGVAAMMRPSRGAAQEKLEEVPLRELARRNIRLGIFTSVYAGLPVAEAARHIHDDGFSAVVLQTSFRDVKFDALKPDWDALTKITAELKKNDVEVVGLYGYYNVIDPNPQRLEEGQARFGALAKYWKRFGSPVISTETGSFDPNSQFADNPENHTEKGYNVVRGAFARLVRVCEQTQAIVAIEPYWHNCIDSIEKAERLFKDVASPSLKLTMDPCNYFRNSQIPMMEELLDDMFKRLGRQIVIAHAKDVRATDTGQEHPAAGKGSMDYPRYLRHLARLNRPVHLIIEHLDISDVDRARDYVKGEMEKI